MRSCRFFIPSAEMPKISYKTMAKDLILTKESSESEIKAYFNAVLKLSQSDNEFPINLDEVWPLVYSEKGKAVRALTSNEQFIEGVDYKMLAQNGKQDEASWGGNNKVNYYLTVSCMEFFIARKVRPVFEVYRQVFHKTVQKAIEEKTEVKQPTISDKMKAATWAAKFLNLNESSKLIIAKQILEPYNLPLPDYTPSKGVLKSASKLLAEMGLKKQISAQVFNKRAIEKGYLYDIERDSSHGQKKQFKSITEKGPSYGENQVSPNNPRETQPLWYADKFSELLGILGFQFMGGLPYEN